MNGIIRMSYVADVTCRGWSVGLVGIVDIWDAVGTATAAVVVKINKIS